MPKVLPHAPRVAINSPSDLCVLLGETLNQVRQGELDPKVANTIGFLSGIMLKAFEQARTEDNLRALLAALSEWRHPDSNDELTDVSHLEEG